MKRFEIVEVYNHYDEALFCIIDNDKRKALAYCDTMEEAEAELDIIEGWFYESR